VTSVHIKTHLFIWDILNLNWHTAKKHLLSGGLKKVKVDPTICLKIKVSSCKGENKDL